MEIQQDHLMWIFVDNQVKLIFRYRHLFPVVLTVGAAVKLKITTLRLFIRTALIKITL